MYTPNYNMFTDFFKSLADWNVLDPSKYSTSFDFDSIMHKNKKHTESATNAQHLVASNMQAIIQRQAEILQENTSRLLNCCKKVSTLSKAEQMVEEQTNFVKETIATNLAHTRELMEMATKAQMEVMDHLGHTASENINECCNHAKKSKKS